MIFPTKQCECGLNIALPQLKRHLRGEMHLNRTRKQPERNIKFRDKPRIPTKRKPKKIIGPSPAEMRLQEVAAKGMPGWEDTFPDLPAPISNVVNEIVNLFKKKNAEYTNGRDTFHNFDSAAPVVKGVMSPFTYCMTLSDKQNNAMWVAIHGNKPTRERLFDQVVYGIIGLALLDRKEGN